MRFFKVVDGALHYRVGNNDQPLDFRGDGEFTSVNERFRFHPDSMGVAEEVNDLGTVGVDTFVLNNRPDEPSGPDKPAWKDYLGNYTGSAYGEKVPLRIYIENGYLYASRAGGTKLIEYRPGTLLFGVGRECGIPREHPALGQSQFHARLSSPGNNVHAVCLMATAITIGEVA